MRNLEIVRNGYNRITAEYLEKRKSDSPDIQILHRFTERLHYGARILDAGCGSGVPVTLQLANLFKVTGVDFSVSQLKLAKKFVLSADLVCQDLTAMGFAESSFDAICSYYSIIHIPRNYHAQIFTDFYKLLSPGGIALICLGADDLEDDIQDDYCGTKMYWSHYDAATNLRMIKNAGFLELWSEIIPDVAFGGGKHLFVLAEKSYA